MGCQGRKDSNRENERGIERDREREREREKKKREQAKKGRDEKVAFAQNKLRMPFPPGCGACKSLARKSKWPFRNGIDVICFWKGSIPTSVRDETQTTQAHG